jgi:tripartite-type tricarboxylate transporter receptor subunit TctC
MPSTPLSRRVLLGAGAGAGTAYLARGARAQATSPIRIIVPFAPGSAGDVVGRLLAEQLSPILGRPVLVETRPGAGGNIGAAAVAAASPDGGTLLLGATNNFAVNQFLYRAMAFDPVTALAPVSIVADVPSVILTNARQPATTLAEFVAFAKSRPVTLNFASPGAGSTPHLGAELLARHAGISMLHVPYRGGGEAATALLQDQVQLYLVGYGVARPLIEGGGLRPLAVASMNRLAVLPQVPTTAEAGFPGVIVNNWWGLAGPGALPLAQRDAMAGAVREAMARAGLAQRLEALGFVVVADTPAAMERTIREDAARWSAVIRELGVTLD